MYRYFCLTVSLLAIVQSYSTKKLAYKIADELITAQPRNSHDKARFARHIQTVTESSIDHVVRRIRQKLLNDKSHSNWNERGRLRDIIKALSVKIKSPGRNGIQKSKEKEKTYLKYIKKNVNVSDMSNDSNERKVL